MAVARLGGGGGGGGESAVWQFCMAFILSKIVIGQGFDDFYLRLGITSSQPF